jgi:hypothetical protein
MSTLSCAFASMAKELGGLAQAQTADDSNESLVGAGVTDAIPLLLGLPVLVNREMPSYSGVMLDRSAVVSAVGEVYVSVSEHRYFKFDSQLLRSLGAWDNPS